jgi:hypothetical protein
MTDQELIDYCDGHCHTPRAMFCRNHIRRMFVLAGNQKLLRKFDLLHAPDWFSVHADAMQPLVDAARRRLEKQEERGNNGRLQEGR